MSNPIPLFLIITQRNVFGTEKTIQNWKHDSDSYNYKLQSNVFLRVEWMELLPT
jgi:hypothetical protein